MKSKRGDRDGWQVQESLPSCFHGLVLQVSSPCPFTPRWWLLTIELPLQCSVPHHAEHVEWNLWKTDTTSLSVH